MDGKERQEVSLERSAAHLGHGFGGRTADAP